MISFFTKNFPNVVALGWGGDAGWGTAIFQTLFMTFWNGASLIFVLLLFWIIISFNKTKRNFS